MVDIELLESNYFVNAEPVPYRLKKGDNIYITPILLKDANVYDWAIDILQIQKEEINNIEIIKMSYLDFIVNFIIKNDETNTGLNKFISIMKLCLNVNYFAFSKDKGKTCILICDEDGTIKQVISSKEFNEIKSIILHQNNANYDDRHISKDVKDLMKEYYKTKYSNSVSPTLEKRKAFVCSKLGKTFKEINDFTYREFELIYQSCIDSEIYIGNKIIEASYKFKVDEVAKHPLFEKKKDPYSELFEDTSVLSNKGISGAENLNRLNL